MATAPVVASVMVMSPSKRNVFVDVEIAVQVEMAHLQIEMAIDFEMLEKAEAFAGFPLPPDFEAGGQMDVLMESRRVDVQIERGMMREAEFDLAMIFHEREVVVQVQAFGQVRQPDHEVGQEAPVAKNIAVLRVASRIVA